MRVPAWVLGPALFALPIPPAAAQDGPAPDVRALFLEHCASCHGGTGDGVGTAELPRPARSFLDGGFSYGNTRTAIERTILHGIPGTPMPSFREALGVEQREAMVEYVIGLGPPREEVDPRDTVIVVGERALVVRGHLPALRDGAPAFTRGILIGLPTGTTFQYRADDVRLVAVRQGEFVERRDWVGRGGNPLNPLGAVTFECEDGNPGTPFELKGGEALTARLIGTWVEGQSAGVAFELRRSDGSAVAMVRETPGVVSTEYGSGFVRRFEIESRLSTSARLALGALYVSPDTHAFGMVIEDHNETEEGRRSDYRWAGDAWNDGEGRYLVTTLRGPPSVFIEGDHVQIDLDREPITFELTLISSVDAETASKLTVFGDW